MRLSERFVTLAILTAGVSCAAALGDGPRVAVAAPQSAPIAYAASPALATSTSDRALLADAVEIEVATDERLVRLRRLTDLAFEAYDTKRLRDLERLHRRMLGLRSDEMRRLRSRMSPAARTVLDHRLDDAAPPSPRTTTDRSPSTSRPRALDLTALPATMKLVSRATLRMPKSHRASSSVGATSDEAEATLATSERRAHAAAIAATITIRNAEAAFVRLREEVEGGSRTARRATGSGAIPAGRSIHEADR